MYSALNVEKSPNFSDMRIFINTIMRDIYQYLWQQNITLQFADFYTKPLKVFSESIIPPHPSDKN